MTCLFSKGIVNNYGQGGWTVVWNRVVYEIFWRTQSFLRFLGGGSENVLGYSTWNMIINIMVWTKFIKKNLFCIRYLAHNGEINTLRGNKNLMSAREGVMSSHIFGDNLQKLYPVVEDGMSDSGSIDNVLEFLINAGGRSLPEVSFRIFWAVYWYSNIVISNWWLNGIYSRTDVLIPAHLITIELFEASEAWWNGP